MSDTKALKAEKKAMKKAFKKAGKVFILPAEVKGKFIFLTAISYKCFVFTVIHIFFYFRTLIHTA